MAGDGISLQTTISQLGNVAKTQLKGQQGNQHAAPLSDQLDKSKDLKVNRVKKADQPEKGRVEPDAEQQKRRHSGLPQPGKEPEEAQGPEDRTEGDEGDRPATAEDVGSHIDTRV